MAASQTFNIVILVNPAQAVSGARKVEKGLGRVGRTADKLRKLLRNVFVLVGIASLIRSLTGLADKFLAVQNRIRVVTEGTAQLNHVTAQLFKIARETRSEFGATAELYARLAINSRELGRNQQELLQFTKSLNQAIIISGATAKEANSGLIQLSQGLASGVLRGDELRSVLEQLPTVADTISHHMGITRGELRAMGQEGKITADIVIDSFLAAEDTLGNKFGKTIPTLSQALIVLKNSMLEFWGQVETATGMAGNLARALLGVADNMDTVARVTFTATFAIGTAFATIAIPKAIIAIKAMKLALLTSGWGAIIVLIGTVIGALIAFNDKILVSSGHVAHLGDLFGAFVEIVGEWIRAIWKAIPGLESLVGALDSVKLSIHDVMLLMASMADLIIGVIGALGGGIVAVLFALFHQIKGWGINIMNVLGAVAEGIVDFFKAAFSITMRIAREFSLTMIKFFSQMVVASEMMFSGQWDEASKAALEAGDMLLNDTARAAKRIPQIIKEEWAKVRADELFPDIENSYEDVDWNKFIADTFMSGWNLNPVTGLVNDMFARAQAAADKRQLDLGAGGEGKGPGKDEPAVTGMATATEKLASMQRETEVMRQILALSGEQLVMGEREVEMSKIREDFRKKNITLTDKEIVSLLSLIEEQVKFQQGLQAQQTLLQEIRGPQEALILQFEALAALQPSLTIQEYTQALRDLNIAQAELGTGFGSGITVGLAKVQENIVDIAGVTQSALVNAFQSAEDALVDFAMTGEVDMQAMAVSMLKDIARIISKLLIMQAIEAGAGAGIPGLDKLITPRQHGGPVGADKPYMVGEQGPELFVPSGSGNIMSHDATMSALGTSQKQAAPVVNVSAPPATIQVINVSDPNEVPDALNSPDGEQAVLNVIQRNPALVRNVIS